MPLLKWWEWAGGRFGLNIEDDQLVWWEAEGPVRCASGGAAYQSFEDFLHSGPRDTSAPVDVVAQATAEVRRLMAERNRNHPDEK